MPYEKKPTKEFAQDFSKVDRQTQKNIKKNKVDKPHKTLKDPKGFTTTPKKSLDNG